MTKGGYYKLILMIGWILLMLPTKTLAAKTVSLSAEDNSVKVDDLIEVKISIDTGGAKVNAVGFNIDFPTETLSGRVPNQAGSAFPVCAVLTSTRYDCGASGQNGFSGKGLLTTLAFTGKKTGKATIGINNFEAHYGPQGEEVGGFTIGAINITVTKTAKPTPTPSYKPLPISKITNPIIKRVVPQKYQQKKSEIKKPGKSFGSQPNVNGDKGSKPEDLIKKAESVNPEVKGFYNKNKGMFSFFPTLLLLILVVWLVIKLYFTEKKRHLELENLLETQLGALSTLENKLDLVEQKGDVGKETIIKEIEEAKAEMVNEAQEKGINKIEPGKATT